MKKSLLIILTAVLASCAQLHHIQLGEIKSVNGYVQKPFDIKFSETGVNIEEAAEISKIFLNDKGDKNAEGIANFIGMFQMGPRTGQTVYSANYARNLIQAIYEKCPSGNVTGLSSIRESRKYPVVSGEIVKVTGFCLIKKGT